MDRLLSQLGITQQIRNCFQFKKSGMNLLVIIQLLAIYERPTERFRCKLSVNLWGTEKPAHDVPVLRSNRQPQPSEGNTGQAASLYFRISDARPSSMRINCASVAVTQGSAGETSLALLQLVSPAVSLLEGRALSEPDPVDAAWCSSPSSPAAQTPPPQHAPIAVQAPVVTSSIEERTVRALIASCKVTTENHVK